MTSDLLQRSIEAAAELISKGSTADSEVICRQILKLDPDNAPAMCLLSRCLERIGEKEESARVMAAALATAGQNPQAHNSVGIACMHAREMDMAVQHFAKAEELDPTSEDPPFNLASCLLLTGRPEEASKSFRRAHKASRSHKSLIGLSCAMAEMLDLEGATSLLEEVLADDPKNTAARTNMASVLHLSGRWDEAWPYCSSRLEHHERLKKLVDAIGLPLWVEGPPPKGNILVFSEQGVGDAINFGRFSAVLQARHPDRKIATLAPPSLRRLLGTQGVKTTEATEGFDFCCSMMDIPGLLKMSRSEVLDSFAIMKPFATCDTSAFNGLLKVGVCWAGNPANPRDPQRSCRLSEFKEISSTPGLKLFSLQKDTRPRVWPTSPDPVDLSQASGDMRLVDMAPHMVSWEHTAAVISAMDLVISVDTSVMHLAASLGKETWGLLPYVPDWRWGLGSEDTCWYPSLKLFRQSSPGDWAGVFSAVREQLGRKTH